MKIEFTPIKATDYDGDDWLTMLQEGRRKLRNLLCDIDRIFAEIDRIEDKWYDHSSYLVAANRMNDTEYEDYTQKRSDELRETIVNKVEYALDDEYLFRWLMAWDYEEPDKEEE